jgi:hypothetical protein
MKLGVAAEFPGYGCRNSMTNKSHAGGMNHG